MITSINLSSLVLNIAYIPIEIISWQKAVSLFFEQKAKILSNYEDRIIHSPSMSMPVPAVILREDTRYLMRAFTNVMPFNRYNLFKRDDGRCMYCGKKVLLNEFNFEHVIPKDQGGECVWENIVVSCIRCNIKKRNRTPKEAGMKLIREPFILKLDKPVARKLIKKLGMKIPHKTWLDYVYWTVILNK